MAPKQYYSYALNSESRLIHAEKAEKGNEYRCPNCGGIMIPKQGERRAKHFAHKANTENCSYETYLHKIAKRRICECFNKSEKFTIRFNPKVRCAVAECPLGAKQPCEWTNKLRTYDLKKYYSKCEEEKYIDNFKADLLVDGCMNGSTKPILIEIWVTHRSTDEKLKSGLRIIEIHIESEEDIDQIVDTSSIIQNEVQRKAWEEVKQNDKIQFYNFKTISKKPDEEHQSYNHVFWIDARGYFHFSDTTIDHVLFPDESLKCLKPNPPKIANSIFRIESRNPIDIDFALYKLADSGLSIRYCKMCKYYKWNEYNFRSMCILYRSKGTPKYPNQSVAKNCLNFRQKDYAHDDGILSTDLNQECKITIKK